LRHSEEEEEKGKGGKGRKGGRGLRRRRRHTNPGSERERKLLLAGLGRASGQSGLDLSLSHRD